MEKTETHEHRDEMHDEKNIVETRIITGNEAFQEALIKEPPNATAPRSIILFLCCLLGFLASTMNGYDGSLFNSLLENKDFLKEYHGENAGIWPGIVASMYQIGSVVALPFIGPIVDGFGRKIGMAFGSLCVVLGTIVQATSASTANVGQFEGGRFLVGYGVSIATAAAPMYVVEVSHPAFRGVVTAFYNTFWFTGSILCAGVVRGSDNLTGHITWRLPIWIQLFFPGIICLFWWFLPESPRWLYVHGKQEKAKAMLSKWHAEGNTDSVWVSLQLSEYEEHLELNGSDKRWWDYRALFRSRASCFRVFCNICIQAFGQLAGNSVLSYFQSAAFDTAGLTDTIGQNNATLGNACQQFFFSLIGASLVDRVGRRPLLLFSNAGCCLVWLCMTIAAATFANSGKTNKAAGDATLFFQFLFGSVYSVGFTPLQALYPVEVLSFEMRAKGMAFGSMFMNLVSIFNNYSWPPALKAIGWKTYIVFTVWCAFQATVIYFFIPETKNRTLEELDEIFNSPDPVNTSLIKKKLAVTSTGEVMQVEDV